MDLNKTLELLKDKNPEYKNAHERILKILNIPLTSSMKSYIELIHNDHLHWFNAFPSVFASYEALAKPKSALLFLLEKQKDVRDELGVEYCDNLANSIGDFWRANKEELINTRKFVKEQTNKKTKTASIDDDDQSQRNDEELIAKAEKKITDLSSQVKQLGFDNDKLNTDKLRLLNQIIELKSIFIDALKDKGASDAEVLLISRLLQAW